MLHDTARILEDKIKRMALNIVWLSFIIIPLLALLVVGTDPAAFAAFLSALVLLSPVWLPVFLIVILWIAWIQYIRHKFWYTSDMVVIYIQPPPEITKSPHAMEIFLTALFHTGSETTFLNRVWQGRFRNTWSIELASVEGRVGFYMHLRRMWKDSIETRLYGQYPEAKITEVEDYIAKIPFNLEEYDMWCGEFGKQAIKPGAAPVKTYIDFGLDKDTDTPETTVDPIINMLEILSSLGKDEYAWMQIIMRAHAKEDYFGFYRFGDPFKKEAEEYIRGKIASAAKRAKEIAAEQLMADETQQAQIAGRGMTMLTEEEKNEIAAIERNMNKPVYECGLRVCYVAKKERFRGINGAFFYRFFDGVWGPYNRIAGIPGRGLIGFDYPWEDPLKFRKSRMKELLYFHSKHRAFFYVPYDQKHEYFSTEELATIWHFPDSSVQTPGLERVAARRAEAPANLPVQTQEE